MKLITRICVLFYVTLILFLGVFILFYVANLVEFEGVVDFIYLSYYDDHIRLMVGAIAAGLLFFNFLFYRLFSSKIQKEKTIVFDNPTGRVSVSLFAIEDLIRNIVGGLPEVKEVKPFVIATKKGLQVELRLILRAETNIPDFTAKVQELVRRKMTDVINLDEPVNVTVHVNKISFEHGKDKRKKDREETDPKSELYPFQGYRA